MLNQTLCGDFFPHIQMELPGCSLWPLSFFVLLFTIKKSLSLSSFSLPNFRYVDIIRPLSYWTERTIFCRFLHLCFLFHYSDVLVLHWKSSMIFCWYILGSPKLEYSSCRGIVVSNYFPQSASNSFDDIAQNTVRLLVKVFSNRYSWR